MNWLRRLLYGRNGIDPLGIATMLLGMLILIVAQWTKIPLLGTLYYLCGVVFFFRVLSRNVYRRQRENQAFLSIPRKIRSWFQLRVRILRERSQYKYLKCPHCKQRLRAPRGKGKINIRCQQCGNRFIRTV